MKLKSSKCYLYMYAITTKEESLNDITSKKKKRLINNSKLSVDFLLIYSR